jgi:hypothetical protein
LSQGGSGATLVFNYANFSGSPAAISLVNFANFNGSSVQLFTGTSHNGGGAYYTTQQPSGTFTNQFTFNYAGFNPTGNAVNVGMSFVIAKSFGIGDANMGGYGGAMNQGIGFDSMAIKFDPAIGSGTTTAQSSTTGMYLNQGTSPYPGGGLGLVPMNDLGPYGINFYTDHTFQVTMVYDGSLLTMTILDTTTNAQGRYVWPLNVANTTNGGTNTIGFVSDGSVAGQSGAGPYSYINSWTYWTGYNTRLATPTFSPSPGNYTSSQTVTISYPAGSTCYYTTNGLLPTSASTQYTGPITVSANTILQAVAIESNYTDSLVASGNYVIGTSSNTINFPSGFSAGNLLPVGFAYLSGSTYRLTDTNGNTAGAVWFPVPVTVSSFSTAFTLDLENGAQGMCFVIQNPQLPAQALTGVQITGTSGQISFNALSQPLQTGNYITIAGTFGGTGSISGYSNPTSYIVGATNGTTTATLCGNSTGQYITSASQSGTTFNTSAQSLVAGTGVWFSNAPGGFGANQIFYVVSSGLTSTTCEIAATPGGTPISVSSSSNTTIYIAAGSAGGGATITTTTGTPTGLTYSVNTNVAQGGGPTALGIDGAGLGYGGYNAANGTAGQAFGLLNSVAISFAQYASGGDPSNSIGFYTNGATPYGSGISTGLTFNTTFNVTLTYSGTSLSLTMQATGGGTTFSHTFTGVNIPSIVGANTAYVGFTGGSGGGAHAVQAITQWTM